MVKSSVGNPYAPVYNFAPWGTTGTVHANCYDYAFNSFSSRRNNKSVPGNRSGNRANGLTFTTCAGIAKRVVSDNPRGCYQMKNPSAKPRVGFYKVFCFVAPKNDFGNSTGDFHWYRQTSAVNYRIRPGDRLASLAKFFRVSPSVIKRAITKARSPKNMYDGKISRDLNDYRFLNKLNLMTSSERLKSGKVITIPVSLWSHKQGWSSAGPILVDASGKTISDPRKCNRNYVPGFHYTKFCSAYAVRKGAQTGNNSNRGRNVVVNNKGNVKKTN